MNSKTVSAAEFATHILESFVLRGYRIPSDFASLLAHEAGFFNYFLSNRLNSISLKSRSQLFQDLWVIYLLDALNPGRPAAHGGFFVEFGAFDGVTLSNSFLLETSLGWKGILAEPSPTMFAKCLNSRKCLADPRCVWHTSGGELEFNEVPGHGELATIQEFSALDLHAKIRSASERIIKVATVSLNDLLDQHNAPQVIDYISIDTEGSEWDILSKFDFARYRFRVISIEHNSTPMRGAIRELLVSKGYKYVARSVDLWDDMYVEPELIVNKA